MNPISWLIENPVKVSVGVILLVLFGTIALFNMPMQLSPDVTRPQISISTSWPGASPHEIEKEIVNEQEEKLKSVEGVIKMTSESQNSEGRLDLEFRVGTNMTEAMLKVNSQLQQVRDYPVDADKPVIRTSSQSDRSIAWYILSSRPPTIEEIDAFTERHPELREPLARVRLATNVALRSYRLREAAKEFPAIEELLPPEQDLQSFKKFAEDYLEPQLERVSGVGDASVRGGQAPQVHVVVDSAKLSARGLTISDLRSALLQNNSDISAGDYIDGKRQVGVRTVGQYRSLDQVEDQIISSEGGTSVYVRDVADVKMGLEKSSGSVRRYGSTTISISIQRDSGANVVDVINGLDAEVDRLNRGVLAQRGLTLTKVYDETVYIKSAVGLVQQNIVIGGSLTIVILLMFLHLGSRALLVAPLILLSAIGAVYIDSSLFLITLLIIAIAGIWFARGTIVIAIAIPISVIGTFLFLRYFGRTLNVISLAGLAFAVGMLVDNAIVVLENIDRFRLKGLPAGVAAKLAVQEVWGAVLASTLTTLAVFLPVIFLEGEVGQLFGDIALAICLAVGLSLIISVVVIPTASARLLRNLSEHEHSDHSRVARSLESAGTFIGNFIAGINERVQRSVAFSVLLVAGILAVTAAVGWWLFPKVEYLPAGNRNLIICNVLTPSGYNVDQLSEMGAEVEEILKPYWDIEPEFEDTSHLEYPTIADMFCMARDKSVFLGVRAHDDLQARKLIDLLRAKLSDKFPGANVVANQTSLFGRGMGGGRNIDVEINGPDLNRLVELGGEMMGRIRDAMQPSPQVRATPSLDLSSPELHVMLKPEQAAAAGITSDELGYAVNVMVDGAFASDYFEGGEKIDLVIKNRESDRPNANVLSQYIATRNFLEPVRLDAIADAELASGPEQINHRERQRAITLEVSPPDELSLEAAIQKIENEVLKPMEEEGKIGTNYVVNLSGTADKLAQTWGALKWNFALAIFITYLLMAALFESWVYPFVIILSVPLGAVGGIVALQLLSYYLVSKGEPPQSLDVLTMLGFVILVGTVVNNAILIVHQSIVVRQEGIPAQQAIGESLKTRIRPIFMTTLTTVFGLAPLVFFPGAGSELYRGLGSVVLGGLLVSTVLTLFLIPTLLSLMVKFEAAFKVSDAERSETTKAVKESPEDGIHSHTELDVVQDSPEFVTR
ncbi:MAG: efflux RND transporter permease subunit [Pirellulaceae bacterium]